MVKEMVDFLKKREQVDMACGPVGKTLVMLAVPQMISLLFQNLYAFVDTIFVSWLGSLPLAAVSLAVPLLYLALALAKGISMGSVILISHGRGAQDEGKVKAVSAAILPLMTVTMCLFLPLMIPALSEVFFTALGAQPAVLPHLYGFTFWLVAGFPIMGMVMSYEALFIAKGDTVTPMKGMILGNILNILLDPVLIFTLGLGAAGAAVATLFGQTAAAAYLYSRLGEERPAWNCNLSMVREWKWIMGQGGFIALSYMIIPIGLMLLNQVLSRYEPTAVGAWNIMSRMEMLVMLPVMGMSNAMAAFLSFNFGRREFDRIRQGVRVFLKMTLSMVLPVALVFILFPRGLVTLFQVNSELLTIGGYAVRASGAAMVFMTVVFALIGTAQGLKRPYYMVIISAVHVIGIRVPAAYWLGNRWGTDGVFWSHTAAAAGAAMLSGFYLYWLLSQYLKEKEQEAKFL